MLLFLFLLALLLFGLAYRFYGTWQSKIYELNPNSKTPAEELYDGIDYVPTHPAILLGHHFSSIAGAGPIVGPITAASMFGWLPTYLWIVLGSVFFGGVQDMGSIVGSIRHRGLSIGELVDKYVGRRGKTLFLIFTWLALVLLISAFLELTAQTFSADAAVAFSAVVYIVLAIIFGLMVYRFNIPMIWSTVIALPFVIGAVFFGNASPWVQNTFKLDISVWRWILIVYIYLASVLPVWILLQPRDYLSSWFLYFTVIVGTLGLVLGVNSFNINIPAFQGFVDTKGNYLWPILFVTVACGAISGFHSIVGSGTTAKQIRKETDAKLIGYGGMLIEGLVAVIALSTIMLVGGLVNNNPMLTYGTGFGKFWSLLGLKENVGVCFGLFAINTFILTTLDTATRLARYQLQELTNMKLDRFTATAIGVIFALILVFTKSGDTPTWKMIWPIFGSANQLVAGLVLLAVSIWIIKGLKKKATFSLIPMVFMVLTTIAALAIMTVNNFKAGGIFILGFIALVLIILAVWLVYEVYVAVKKT